MRGTIYAALLLGVVLFMAAGAGAQAPLPMTVSLNVTGHGSETVDVQGTTLPGTVVSVRGATKVVDESGAFTLRTSLPFYLVAVRGSQLRKVTMALPDGAHKWVDRLTIAFNLTMMRAEVDGTLMIKNHPPATVTVEHLQTRTTVKAPVTHGAFSLDLPLVQKTNTLDWSLRAGWITWAAPPLSYNVQ